MMITRVLSHLSGTPRYERGMRAYDVKYWPPDEDDMTTIVTYGNQTVGDQIRQTLFESHPQVTDYTFQEFDYLSFQERVIKGKMHKAIAAFIGIQLASHSTNGEGYVDLTQEV